MHLSVRNFSAKFRYHLKGKVGFRLFAQWPSHCEAITLPKMESNPLCNGRPSVVYTIFIADLRLRCLD